MAEMMGKTPACEVLEKRSGGERGDLKTIRVGWVGGSITFYGCHDLYDAVEVGDKLPAVLFELVPKEGTNLKPRKPHLPETGAKK